MVVVRRTDPAERGDALAVITAAFEQGSDAPDIAARTWKFSEIHLPALDLVALEEGEVVGHVLGGAAQVGETPVVALAPLAVRPDRQRQGIGSRLVRELIDRADAAGYPLIALYGSHDYYPRFGFEVGLELGVDPGGDLRDPRAFMVRRLTEYSPTCRGRYLPGYDRPTEDYRRESHE